MPQATTLTLIVPGEPPAGRAGTGQEVRGARAALRSLLPQRKEVNLGDVTKDLERVQNEIDTLLASIKKRDSGGFRLAEVEVSLAISASGSIGVATAGVEVGLTLTFAQPDGSS